VENDAAGSGADSRLPAPARGHDGGGEFLLSEPGRSPVLDAAQVQVLRKYGTEYDVAVGDVLFADGDETYDLIVMLDGTAEIIKGFGQPGATVIATYGQSEFLGKIGMLTGQRAYLTAVVSSAGRVLAVPVRQLRVVMAHEPGLSDLILRTFLLRHSILMRRGGPDADRIALRSRHPAAAGDSGAGQLAQDSHGFLLTGSDIPPARLAHESSAPLFLETSWPGIFAVGDVRSGSVKRAAAAIGEGSMAVRLVYDRIQFTGTV